MENMTKLLTELTINENEISKKAVRKEKVVTSKKSNLEIALSRFNEQIVSGSKKIVSAFDKKINSDNSWIALTNGTIYVPAIVSLIPRIDRFYFCEFTVKKRIRNFLLMASMERTRHLERLKEFFPHSKRAMEFMQIVFRIKVGSVFMELWLNKEFIIFKLTRLLKLFIGLLFVEMYICQ